MVDATRPMGIITVNYGSHRLIEENIGAIRFAVAAGVHIIVVDNYSSGPERDAITSIAANHNWELVGTTVNIGFGAAVNMGVARARDLGCTSLLMLNPDARVAADTVLALQRHCDREPLSAVTPELVTSDGHIAFRGSTVLMSSGRIRGRRLVSEHDEYVNRSVGTGERAWLPGTCLAMSVELFERAGAFSAQYFLYWEDVDLSYRCEQVGGSLVVKHGLTAVHEEGGTQGARRGRALSRRYYYYNCRNRLIFAVQHLPKRTILAWMLKTPSESWQILMRGGRRQLLHSPGTLLATVGGSAAGLWIAARSLCRKASRQAEALTS